MQKLLIYILLIPLVSGITLSIASYFSPHIGLGIKEDYIFYSLFDFTRRQTFLYGILMALSAVIVICFYSYKTNKPSYLNRYLIIFRSYFAFPPVSAHSTFNARDQLILLLAAVLFQTIYLFIIPLGFECDAAMYFNYAKYLAGLKDGVLTYWKGPGFPAFIALTGQFVFHSFIGTVMVHAVMGALMPVIVYRTLVPVHRLSAFIAAAVLIFSSAPFFAAKLMLTEQLYTFSLVTMLYCFSRYYFTRDVRFIYFTVFLGFLAFFTRWEASFPFFISIGLLFFICRKQKNHLRHFILPITLVALIGTGWSAVRSYNINCPSS